MSYKYIIIRLKVCLFIKKLRASFLDLPFLGALCQTLKKKKITQNWVLPF